MLCKHVADQTGCCVLVLRTTWPTLDLLALWFHYHKFPREGKVAYPITSAPSTSPAITNGPPSPSSTWAWSSWMGMTSPPPPPLLLFPRHTMHETANTWQTFQGAISSAAQASELNLVLEIPEVLSINNPCIFMRGRLWGFAKGLIK